jgi:glycosyltransferase involved in cell wall biosynthesis
MSINIYKYIDNFKKIKPTDSKLIFSHKNYIKNPYISIIITVYKRKNCLYEAINSALGQININFEYEIIVLDDDPEGVFERISDYYSIKNISFYRNTRNLGLFNNLNMGALLAKGKYISYLHDDDLLYPNYLSEVYILLSTRTDAKCVLVNRDVIGLSDRIDRSKTTYSFFKVFFLPFEILKTCFEKPYKKITPKDGLTYLLSNLYKAPSCGTLFNKKSFIKCGGYNDSYYPVSDYFYFLLFNKFYNIYMLKNKLASYRWLENLSQQKDVQLHGLKILNEFFKSLQPYISINLYYKIFHNEIFHAKYLMINNIYRDDIKNEFVEMKKFNRYKWLFFKSYNILYKYMHNLI